MKSVELLEVFWKKPIISVFLVLILATAISVSSIWLVEKGTVTDYPIRDIGNRHIVAEELVKGSDVNFSNPVFFYMRCDSQITRSHCSALINFCEKLEEFFEKQGLGDKIALSSLVNITDYHSSDLDAFLSNRKLNDTSFDVRKWAENNLSRIDVDGGLAGKITGEYEYFLVTILPDQDFPEIELYRSIRSFLKGEDLSIWELYLSPDIKIDLSFFPKDVKMTIEPMGWSEGRGEIDVYTNAETWFNVFGGILGLSMVILLLVLLPRQAIASLVIITIAFLANRALIGVFDFVSIWMSNGDIRYIDDVFSVLFAPASLIAGLSFPLRSFYKFNFETKRSLTSSDNKEKMSERTYWGIWRITASKVFSAVSLVTFIAISDYILFLGLQQYEGSRSMWQVAIFSATGISFSYFLTVVFLPPFYKLIGGKKIKPYMKRFSKSESFLSPIFNLADRCISSVSRFFLRRAAKKGIALPLAVFSAVVILAVLLLGKDMLITDSKPQELLESVPMGEVIQELRKPGRPGFNVSQVYIQGDLRDPAVLDRIWSYSQEMEKAGRTVFSPINFFVSIMERDVPGYQKGGSIEDAILDFVRDDSDPREAKTKARSFAQDIWNDILDSDSDLMRHFLTRELKEMINIFTFSGDKATEITDYVNLLYSKAEKHDLDVLVPTKLAQYAEVDRMISQGPFDTDPPWGILLNDTMSQFVIVLIVFLVFCYQNTKRKGCKIRPFVGGILVIIPFVFSSMIVLIFMMLSEVPYDIASASMRAITVSVAVDLPIFLILGFQRYFSEEKDFEKVMLGAGMQQEANEVLIDATVNSLAFIFLIRSGFPAIHRLGIMLDLAMLMFALSTLWIVMPLLRYSVKKS